MDSHFLQWKPKPSSWLLSMDALFSFSFSDLSSSVNYSCLIFLLFLEHTNYSYNSAWEFLLFLLSLPGLFFWIHSGVTCSLHYVSAVTKLERHDPTSMFKIIHSWHSPTTYADVLLFLLNTCALNSLFFMVFCSIRMQFPWEQALSVFLFTGKSLKLRKCLMICGPLINICWIKE